VAGPTTLRMRPQNVGEAVGTIVVVMMENRSFDHLLGWMSLPQYGGRSDIEGLKGDLDPKTRELLERGYQNSGRSRIWRPFMAKVDDRLKDDLPHGRDRVWTQMHAGKTPGTFAMDGFVEAWFQEHPAIKLKPDEFPDPMRMMPPELVPATAFLARNFMVCDHWFSPIPTDTHPNRLMSLCGYTKIDQTSGEPKLAGPIPGIPDHETVLDWCEDRNLRWRVYSEHFSFVTLFTALRPHGLEHEPKHFRNVSELAHDFRSESEATFPQFILVEPAYSDDPLVKKPDDNHPPNPMGPGEAFLAEVYRAVTVNPKRWESTVMILLYDEHGGFWDHVPPFPVTTAPPGFSDDAWTDKNPFKFSGPRVPAIVVSPLVGKGSRSTLRFDHTSILQMLADIADPGTAYSEIVGKRHQEGQIHSLSEVISGSPVQGKAPPLDTFKLAGMEPAPPPQKMTPGMLAFDQARKALAAQRAQAAEALAQGAGPKVKLGAPNYIAARHSG